MKFYSVMWYLRGSPVDAEADALLVFKRKESADGVAFGPIQRDLEAEKVGETNRKMPDGAVCRVYSADIIERAPSCP